MGADPVLEDARHVLTWLERSRPGRFTERELFSALTRSCFPKIGDLDGPLGLLQQHGYLRLIDLPERSGPGRKPSPEHAVHPDIAN